MVERTLSEQGRSIGVSPPCSESVLEAMSLAHRAEVNKLAMQVARYRLLLEEHGIEPPDESGADLLKMWRRCMQMINHATLFAQELGSEKELLEVWS